MARRHSLRRRVALAFAGLGAVLSLLLTTGIWLAAHDVSRRLIDQTLKAELEDYMARRARNPRSLPPATASLRGYLVPAGSTGDDVPPAIRNLPLGQHEIELDAVPYRVAVAERDGDRYLILFSEERQRLREQRFLGYLIGGALLMTLLASVGGRWLAGRVIAPVAELAAAVGSAEPEKPPQLSDRHQSDDEIAELARAFDHYHARLAAFLERERTFAADASHELRTPLAVIRGAAEVLADDTTLTDAQTERIARIQRATEGMSGLIAALLILAREETAPVEEPCDAVQIARDCIERHQALAKPRGTTLSLEAPAPVKLPVPAAMFAIVIANLLHNAVVHTENGVVAVHLDAKQLTVRDTGIGIRDSEIGQVFRRYYRGAESGGVGIGLSLVKRICDRHGWRIELESAASGGTVAKLHFSSMSSSHDLQLPRIDQ
jgi:signal transduction histidine kinase